MNHFKKIILFTLVIMSFFSVYSTQLKAEELPPPEEVQVDTEPEVDTPNPSVTFTIRSGDNLIWQGEKELLDEGSASITDSTSSARSVNARSVLATLNAIDLENESFSITNLTYYESFSSFYLKCIMPASGTELCDNWQYAHGAENPSASIDKYILSGGEHIGIYFGQNRKLVLPSGTIYENENFEVRAQKYSFLDNSWGALSQVTIGVTKDNPKDPWNPIELSTHTVNDQGLATISVVEPDNYKLGIKEDYYFPSYPLSITKKVSGGGGSVGSNTTPTPVFDLEKAVEFLEGKQESNGSWGQELYTDWAIMGLASAGIKDETLVKILENLKSNNEVSVNLTDNIRRAMTLLALGENPYSFHDINYITPVISSFDGTQFGDVNLINEDVFALILLQHVGYGREDEAVNKTLDFILSKQKENGSWEDSVDMTASTIQTLLYFKDETTEKALNKGIDYLKGKQNLDGGWENVFSTSWAIQSIGNDFAKDGKTGKDFMAMNQAKDGGMLPEDALIESRVWATSYAIPAILQKKWSDILQSVPMQEQTLEPVQKSVEPENVTKNSIPKAETSSKKIITTKPKPQKTAEKNTIAENISAETMTASVIETQEESTEKKHWFSYIISILNWIF